MQTLGNEYSTVHLPIARGNELAATKSQIDGMNLKVQTETMKYYQKYQKKFYLELRGKCKHRVDPKEKEDYIDTRIEEDLRYFDLKYKTRQEESYKLRS